MDRGYEPYAIADPYFYESPFVAHWKSKDFELPGGVVPAGWERTDTGDWRQLYPAGREHPSQGWKIHASACLDNAEAILHAVWDYCVPRGITFKFIRNRALLLLRNAKNASRGGSGKFVTIYPSDDAQLEVTLTELGELLGGQPGPYILTDLRWGPGPLYVRYGSFVERYCYSNDGEKVLAIEEPGGSLVPDQRRPTFSPPPWATLPSFLEPHLAARNAVTVDAIPYRIEAALHFSNAGGLYSAVDTQSGDRVVLKEARPHAGLTLDGLDAVARLARERDILQQLEGLPCVPRFRGSFVVGEHHFLAIEFVEGTTLQKLVVRKYPLILPEPDPQAVADYTAWAVDVDRRVEAAVGAVNERGVVIGDVHPLNVLVRPDGEVALVDFEVASGVGERRQPVLAAPGFRAPRHSEGFDIDRHALAALRLALFLPIASILSLEPAKAAELGTEIASLFPVPDRFLSEALAVLGATQPSVADAPVAARRPPAIEPDAEGWRRSRDSMARAILASASPERQDRLFPGDVKLFETGGLNLAYGAAGVLYALDVTGAGRYPEHEEWLLQRAGKPERGSRIGFYDGLHGVAYVLDHLGHRGDALALLEVCADAAVGKLQRLPLDLQGGLAGIGLNFLHFWRATGDASFRDQTLALADIVAGRLGTEDSVPTLSGGEHPHAGLLRGSSGPALLFIRLWEHLGDAAFLDLAATALRQDLRRCTVRPEGTLGVNEGWRTMPYLGNGAVGIGMVLADYLAHRQDADFAEAAARTRLTASCPFTFEPGLFLGKAGMILYLCRDLEPGAGAMDPVVVGHIRRLAWHALSYQGNLAFPGEYLLRLSMDLASGTAGVLLAMGAALHDEPVALPFLGPTRASVQLSQPAIRHPVLAG